MQEVALFSANEAQWIAFDYRSSPSEIYNNRRRWRFACVITALAHDAGKAYCALSITSRDGQKWKKDMPLMDWLRDNNVEEYEVSFLEYAEDTCREISLARLYALVPKETLSFLAAAGQGEKLMEAIRKGVLHGADGGLVGRIVAGANEQSVREDEKKQMKLREL